MTKLVALSKIKDNPYRDKKRNPIDAEKVKSLVESIGTTGFWKGVYGREVGEGVEIAFGHNRVEAARFAGLKEIPVEIEKLSDSDMLMRMARENLQGSLVTSLEAVSAAVKALHEGAVADEAIDPKTRKDWIRYAPSYVPGKVSIASGAIHAYTADGIARILGGVYVRANGHAAETVTAALGILEMEERKVKGFSEQVLQTSGAGPDGKYHGAKKIIEIVTKIKQDEIKVQERAERTAEEVKREEDKQRALQAQIKERQDREKKEHDELLRQQVEARLEQNAAETKKIQATIKEKAAAAEAKAELDKEKLKALNAKVEETKASALEKQKEDEYLPLRKEVERIIHKLERRDMAEELKALARQPLNLKDKQRVWEAIDGLSAWLSTWAAAQFSGPLPVQKVKRRKS